MKLRKWRNHYITFLANIFIFLGFIVNVLIIKIIDPINNQTTSIKPELMIIIALIGGLIGVSFIALDIKYFSKDFPYKKFHYDKKYTKLYIAGISITLANLMIGMLLVVLGVFYSNKADKLNANEIIENFNITKGLIYGSIAVVGFISIIAFTIIRLSRFYIELDLEKRKNNTDNTIKPVNSDDKPVIIGINDGNDKNKIEDDPSSSIKKTDSTKPSAGLSEL
ncbi:DUF5453 family protein [Mycoplasma bradburyae]|uniref:DUF5453 family protein n=1 Tax=Mycoplasma bradburyae TaxID=2963128 RepID=UPI0020CDACBD|nr:DUF5453 family protein [Mycoplasma bradburyae]UTS70619.1 DUF5453 family protein [Mycoplasma bradburyae]